MALQLMRAGFQRVSVVRGGFPALLTAGVPVAPKAVSAEPMSVAPRDARPKPS